MRKERAAAAVAELMATFLAHPGHPFWPDKVTLLDRQHVHAAHLLDSAQGTDSYLPALAVAHGGKRTTFGRQLVTHAVLNGSQALHVIRVPSSEG